MAGITAGLSPASAKPTPIVPLLPGPLIKTPAVLMAPRSDGLEVVWAVDRLARGWVEWQGPDGSTGRAAADAFGFVPQGEQVIRVRVAGLKPGTDYQLRAVAEAGDGAPLKEAGPWKKFRTLDPHGATTSFVVWNDTHQWADTLKQLHEATPPADFLIWNGDTCNNWDQEDWLTPTLLYPGGQDLSAGRPLFVNWGNHDVRGKWAFKMPAWIATPDGRPYHAFRSGPVACICLHTGEDKPDDHPSFGGRVAFDALRREQAEWLVEATARPEIRDAPYHVVFCHLPLRWKVEQEVAYDQGGYDAFSRRSRDAWHDALVKWRTHVIISGHTHQPAFLPATAEFPYAQLVGGGPTPAQATYITGTADATALRLAANNLAGKVIVAATFPPLERLP